MSQYTVGAKCYSSYHVVTIILNTIVCLVFLSNLFFPVYGIACEPDNLSTSKGWIEWEKGFIYATGIGSVDMALIKGNTVSAEGGSIAAAKADAYSQLCEVINGVFIDSHTLVEHAAAIDNTVRMYTKGRVPGAIVLNPKFSMDESGYPRGEVTLKLPVNNGVYRSFADHMKQRYTSSGSDSPAPYTLPKGNQTTKRMALAQTTPAYTGLIIDTTQLNPGFKPCHFPKILTARGKKSVYRFDPENDYTIKTEHYVSYAVSLEKAKAHRKAGSNPLVVTPLNAWGPSSCDVIISEHDANQILMADVASKMLESCKVIFVMKEDSD